MKASHTYLTCFVDGVGYFKVDENRYRNLHRNRNGDAFSTPPSNDASGSPLDHHHLCKSLVRTSFGASFVAVWREKYNNTRLGN